MNYRSSQRTPNGRRWISGVPLFPLSLTDASYVEIGRSGLRYETTRRRERRRPNSRNFCASDCDATRRMTESWSKETASTVTGKGLPFSCVSATWLLSCSIPLINIEAGIHQKMALPQGPLVRPISLRCPPFGAPANADVWRNRQGLEFARQRSGKPSQLGLVCGIAPNQRPDNATLAHDAPADALKVCCKWP